MFQQLLDRIFRTTIIVLLTAPIAWSGSIKVLRNFGRNTRTPSSGLVVDTAGNAYGTTAVSGVHGAGVVYRLSPDSGYQNIYGFGGVPDGKQPQGNLVIDAVGNLYGTTVYGGLKNQNCQNVGCGTVYRLSPPTNGGAWTETVLYRFTGGDDGANPQAGITMDSTGNIYGTTLNGGLGVGVVFSLTPTGNGQWNETVLHTFTNHSDGALPQCQLAFDKNGNLYGTAGWAFELIRNGDGTWTYTIIYRFDPDKGDPVEAATGVILDDQGNLFGTSQYGGKYHQGGNLGYGTVFELSPNIDGTWSENIIYSFAGDSDGATPQTALAFDAAGNLYGTTYHGGGTKCDFNNGCGTVFTLTPDGNGGWSKQQFAFPSNANFGILPSAPAPLLVMNNHLYGTTTGGGQYGGGVVYEITP